MNKVIINGEEFLNIEEFHKYIKVKMELPDYYGENLNALWDCITGFIDLPLLLVWVNFEKSKVYIGKYAEEVLQVFKEAQNELEDDFIVEVK
ncbi:barnase inhibitor [Lottiidibacillus patelloidae]|uniref:Barnase inhibitor n=1 Tax=Lottiidibacillus patelloidae TaxID=2670334 RepID=A0A263BXF5_9BACI|nr:barstar family protein [Lottiidibacillus patelloidae]OZM58409.1 barnase inhibitor [Lottiidibacillus patelloidae]